MRDIYVITNAANGKRYVGQSKDAAQRFRAHLKNARRGEERSALYAAIRKHGAVAFSMTVVERVETRPQADERERHWIYELNALTSGHGYNMQTGGEGGFEPTPEVRARIGAWARARTPEQIAKMRRPRSPEGRANIAAAQRARHLRNPEPGRAAIAHARLFASTNEARAKISAAHKGKPKSSEHRAKIAAAKRGKKNSPEHVAKSAAAKLGSRHTAEAKARISAAGKIAWIERRIIAEANAFADSVLRVARAA